jgi:outer membrane protein assembly factor BamE (lipoprotein component of BamABCDE complex)
MSRYNTTIRRSLHRAMRLPFRSLSLVVVATVAAILVVTGCAWAPTWGVYKIDINQGNFVTQDLVDKVRAGQSKSQVKVLLGTPLVSDAFHANRWDYIYRFETSGRVREEHRLTVLFEDDKVVKWSNDELPVAPIRGYAGDNKEGVVRSVSAEDDSWWGTIRGWFGW